MKKYPPIKIPAKHIKPMIKSNIRKLVVEAKHSKSLASHVLSGGGTPNFDHSISPVYSLLAKEI